MEEHPRGGILPKEGVELSDPKIAHKGGGGAQKVRSSLSPTLTHCSISQKDDSQTHTPLILLSTTYTPPSSMFFSLCVPTRVYVPCECICVCTVCPFCFFKR
ncbi:unnamed protein product [Arctogadus glacialis]